MQGIPWTKLQDFYLRLGFLKVLVAALSPHRRSATNDGIYRKLETPMFRPLQNYPELYERSADRLDKGGKRQAKGRPYLLEALLIEGCPSWLFAVTSDTVYKILDWGHDIDLVGRGNQISERGLILRDLISVASEVFLSGEVQAWNPFVLTPTERLFFLYHLIEIDGVTLRLVELLADQRSDILLESPDVARLTCRALFEVLDKAQQKLSPSQVPQFRVAFDLAKAIAQELDMREFFPPSADPIVAGRRLPRPPKVIRRTTGGLQSSMSKRRPNKNADHQTIPRCEQLVDLGFLGKPEDWSGKTPPQRRWQYIPTDLCRRWVSARRDCDSSANFLWNGFARAAVSCLADNTIQRHAPSDGDVIRFFADAYDATHRAVGHTPLDSVALRAMLTSAAQGYIIEMATFHKVMLEIKTQNLLPDHAFFAAGNELDKMFINLRPGFREKMIEVGSAILSEARP